MCMTLAFSAPGVGLIAADTRYTFDALGPRDFGRRIRRVQDGWIAGTGNVAVALLALREVEAVGLGHLERALSIVPEVHRHCEARTAKRLADSMVTVIRESDGGFSIHGVLTPDGATVDRPHTRSGLAAGIFSWPVGIDLEHANRINPEWIRRLAASGTIGGLLRSVAEAFDYGRANGRRMSAEVEIGLSWMRAGEVFPLHLRRPTAWVRAASDAELESALAPPPALPPFREFAPEAIAFPTAEAAV